MADKSAKNSMAREEMLRKYDLEKDKLDADVFLKTRDMELKYGTAINTAQLKTELERNRELVRTGTSLIDSALQAQQVQ
jgi:hypothetical protein